MDQTGRDQQGPQRQTSQIASRTVDFATEDHADLDLLAALDELTAPQRAAVVLHHLWDLPIDEVAQMMPVRRLAR